MILKSTEIYIEKETAFRLMDCREDNPLYEELEALYEEMAKELEEIIEPEGVLGFATGLELFGEKEKLSEEYAMVIYTLGGKVDQYIAGLFEQGEYLKGMLADSIADSCLFAMEKEWKKILCRECRKKMRGVKMRMEAPEDFEITLQKRVWELLEGEKIHLSLTSGFMFSPIKTCCYLFLLSLDCEEKNTDQDCSRCSNRNCKLRKENFL